MNKITINNFIHGSHVSEKLIRAVVRQSGGWNLFKECADDITNFGISGGFSGWIYYTETVDFWRKNKSAIMELANNLANDFGENVIDMVGNFNCIKGEYSHDEIGKALYGRYNDEYTTLYNALAWLAVEEVSRSYCDFKY